MATGIKDRRTPKEKDDENRRILLGNEYDSLLAKAYAERMPDGSREWFDRALNQVEYFGAANLPFPAEMPKFEREYLDGKLRKLERLRQYA